MEAPVFIKIEQHKELADILVAVNEKIREASTLLTELQQVKAEEDQQIAAWSKSLDEVKTRAVELHQALFLKQ